MKRFCVLMVLLQSFFFTSVLKAQVAFGGIVLFQNSQKTPAIGVEVRGLGATHDYTTAKGSFGLQYTLKVAGDPAGLDIGGKDKYGKSIELVNAEVIHNVNIPKTNGDNFYVIVCPAGQLAEAKSYYYGLSETKLKAKYEKQIQFKQQQLDETKARNSQFVKIQIELDSLKNRYKVALNRADGLAAYVAAINQDFASDMVNQAINEIKGNQDIERALELINEKKLEEQYRVDMKQKKDAEAGIQRVIEGYNFKIKLFLTDFRYYDAIRCYERVIAMYEENHWNDFNYKLTLFSFAQVYRDVGDYHKTLMQQQKLLQSIDLGTTKSITEIETYVATLSAMGSTYVYLGNTDSALHYLNTAFESNELIKDRKEPEIIAMYHTIRLSVYDGLSLTYRNKGMPYEAAEYARKEIDVAENELGMKGARLGGFYHSAAMTYLQIKRYDTAVALEIRAIILKSTDSIPNSKELAESYKNLAISQLFIPNLRNQSTKNIRLACQLDEKVLQPLDPNLADDYFWAGLLYEKAELIDSSIYYYKNSAKIYATIGESVAYKRCRGFLSSLIGNKKFNDKDYKGAIAYLDSAYLIDHSVENLETIGKCYYYLKKHKKAITYYEYVLEADSGKTVRYIYNDMGLAYASDGQFDKAAEAFRSFEEQHIDTALSYRNWAAYYGLKKDPKAAMKNLELAVHYGYTNLDWITTDESLKRIRNDDRYKKMIKQLMDKKKLKN